MQASATVCPLWYLATHSVLFWTLFCSVECVNGVYSLAWLQCSFPTLLLSALYSVQQPGWSLNQTMPLSRPKRLGLLPVLLWINSTLLNVGFLVAHGSCADSDACYCAVAWRLIRSGTQPREPCCGIEAFQLSPCTSGPSSQCVLTCHLLGCLPSPLLLSPATFGIISDSSRSRSSNTSSCCFHIALF